MLVRKIMKYYFDVFGCPKIKELEEMENSLNKTMKEFGSDHDVHFEGPISTITVENDNDLDENALKLIEAEMIKVYQPHINYLKIKLRK